MADLFLVIPLGIVGVCLAIVAAELYNIRQQAKRAEKALAARMGIRG